MNISDHISCTYQPKFASKPVFAETGQNGRNAPDFGLRLMRGFSFLFA